MGVYVLTPGFTSNEGHWTGPTRSMAWALAEFALRGGFAGDLAAFWPLERLGDVPDDGVAWVLAEPDQLRAALDDAAGGANRHGRRGPGILLTPRHDFWDRPTEAVPEPVDPRGDSAATDRPLGDRIWSEPVDWLALAWSLLQRAEEYLPGAARDTHGRFPAWASSLVRQGLKDRPIVDEMARRIGRRLRALATESGAPKRESGRPEFPVVPWTLAVTHDIDSIRFWNWRRLGVSVLRRRFDDPGARGGSSIAAETEESLFAGASRLVHRAVRAPWFQTLRSSLYPQRDPHWSFPWLRQWETGHRVKPTLFVIPESRTGFEPYDLGRGNGKNGTSGKLIVQLRRWAEDGAEIGVHPPYDAMDKPDRMLWQRERLETVLGGAAIRSARFHWLRFRLPQAWADLARAGLANDATLGHSQEDGFRAGTCHPFLAVDLRTGLETGVVEVPMAAMDTTFRHHQSATPGQAFARLYHLMRVCRASGGVFNLLWHTNSFDGYEWRGWRRVFIRVVEEALEQGATSKTISEIADAHRIAREALLKRIAP